jgi:hypothetical protein
VLASGVRLQAAPPNHHSRQHLQITKDHSKMHQGSLAALRKAHDNKVVLARHISRGEALHCQAMHRAIHFAPSAHGSLPCRQVYLV